MGLSAFTPSYSILFPLILHDTTPRVSRVQEKGREESLPCHYLYIPSSAHSHVQYLFHAVIKKTLLLTRCLTKLKWLHYSFRNGHYCSWAISDQTTVKKKTEFKNSKKTERKNRTNPTRTRTLSSILFNTSMIWFVKWPILSGRTVSIYSYRDGQSLNETRALLRRKWNTTYTVWRYILTEAEI